MPITLRKATQEDLPLIKKLEGKLVDYERSFVPTLIQKGDIEYYDLPYLLNDTEKTLVLIAEDNEKPVGCGFGQIKKNDPCYNQPLYGYIGMVYIEKPYRGKSIGINIIDTLINWLKEKGICEMRLFVYPGNSSAIKTLEKYGFVHHMHEMILKA